MNIIIDANATFNTAGEIKPLYIRLEDEHHELHTYKIEKINYVKEEKYSGIQSFLYNCSVMIENAMKEVEIRYNVGSHKWVLMG